MVIFFEFQVASNFMFPNANINRHISVEFALRVKFGLKIALFQKI